MTIQNDLIACGGYLTKINNNFNNHKLTFPEYKRYYKELLKINNIYFQLVRDIFNNIDSPEIQKFTKELIICEIEAWRNYISFKIDYRGWKEFILEGKNTFLKDSIYLIKNREIKQLLNEIKNKENLLEPNQILEKYRGIGQLYDDIGQEKVVKDWNLFWIALGVIVTIFTIINMKS